MIVGIDGNEANIVRRVGVNTYAYEVLKQLHRIGSKKDSGYSFVVYLREKPLEHMPREGFHWKYRVLHGGGMWVIRKLMPHLILNRDKCEIFWSPNHYLPPICPIPMICSVMDLGYLEFSEQFRKKDFWQLKYWTAISLIVSKYIISISKATCEDIVRHYPFVRNKVVIIRLGYDKKTYDGIVSTKDVRRVMRKYSIVSDYILYLGTLKPSKNIDGLVRAWAKVEKDNPKTVLVIAGKKGWLYESIYRQVERLNLVKRVVFTDFVDEEDKRCLIGGAKGFVAPSYWEGFGLDVVSAMASGVAVVVSDRGSLPEVVGRAGIYVDPEDDESISRGISKLLGMSKKEYNIRVQEGMAQASKFSWEETARGTLEVFERCRK